MLIDGHDSSGHEPVFYVLSPWSRGRLDSTPLSECSMIDQSSWQDPVSWSGTQAAITIDSRSRLWVTSLTPFERCLAHPAFFSPDWKIQRF